MILTNYWWLIIWALLVGGYMSTMVQKQKEYICGKTEYRWGWLPAVSLILPYIIWAGTRGSGFGDTAAYKQIFNEAPNHLNQLSEYLVTVNKDKGFSVLVVLLKTILGNSTVVFFTIIATIQMLLIVKTCRKYSVNYWISIFLFVASTDYIAWMHNGIRQFMAITIIFAATPLIIEKKYVQLIGVILLASTFHASALIMIPIIFIVQGKAWNKRTLLCILTCILIIFFVDKFTDILDSLLASTQYSGMVTDWAEWEDNGTNPIRVLVFSVPMLLSIVGLKYIKFEDNVVVNIMTNFSILACGVALVSMVTSGIFIGRMVEYFSIFAMLLLLPWEIENMFNQKSARIVTILMIVGYIIFFYFQMHFIWGLV